MEQPFDLSALRAGQTALVTQVGGEASMGHRLMDLGLIPGTRVTCLGVSPAGDPAAYLIRGAVIALRRRDAGAVSVRLVPEGTYQTALS